MSPMQTAKMPLKASSVKPSRTPDSEAEREFWIKQKLYHAYRAGRIRVRPDPKTVKLWQPRMEIYDNPASDIIIATFEVPGVNFKKEMSVKVKDEELIVEGVRRSRYRKARHPSVRVPADASMDVDSDDAFFPVNELRYGPFRRTFQLPHGADISCVKTTVPIDGIVTVHWPRDPLAAIHRIKGLNMNTPC
ncbi:hypothetical protein K438DRAFT_817548 [Mycena galopus ATCC 62051]|nr:hypothetical protein K438DRAFT_817548 [Mycena galopus ATCC 62051]